jgi:hypothetical protein
MHSMYKRVQYITHVHRRMKVEKFLPGRRITKTALLVHVHAHESAGACSKLSHLKMTEEAIHHRQEMKNSVWGKYVGRQESAFNLS